MEIGAKVNMPSHCQPFKRNTLMEVWGKKNSRIRQLILGKKFLETNKKKTVQKKPVSEEDNLQCFERLLIEYFSPRYFISVENIP